MSLARVRLAWTSLARVTATDTIASHCEPYSDWVSNTSATARSRTSRGCLEDRAISPSSTQDRVSIRPGVIQVSVIWMCFVTIKCPTINWRSSRRPTALPQQAAVHGVSVLDFARSNSARGGEPIAGEDNELL